MAKRKKLERNNFNKNKKTPDRKVYYFGDFSIAEIHKVTAKLMEQDQSKKEVATIRYALVSAMVGALHMCQIRQVLPMFSSQQIDQLQSYRHIKRS